MPDMLLSFCICLSWRERRPAAADEDAMAVCGEVRVGWTRGDAVGSGDGLWRLWGGVAG